jgi:hypothetical protein
MGQWARLRDELANDPLTTLALLAALIALASTPIAFAVLGRLEWFRARRGRVMQRPEFWSIVCSMILVMGIPAIFAALVLKSRHFDHNRYEFDPNMTWSVLEQGRGYKSLQEADRAVKEEMKRLADERKNLVNTVKKLDESMLALRAVAGTSAAVAQRIPSVLQSLAAVRKSVGVDGPQQLQDFTAPPVDLAAAAANAPTPQPAAVAAASPIVPVAAPAGNGLSPAEAAAEIASVPGPQQAIASMLPLTDVPEGWTVGKSGEKHIETFNADNLYEKIDGRAESFIQYSVKGMAYTFYHPTGDPSNEIQVYIFEMADPLKALGKYGSEKPEDAQAVAVGSEGYTASGSTLFYAGKYYTQIVSTQDDPKFAAFALEIAKKVAAKQVPGSGGAAPAPAPAVASAAATPATPPPPAQSKAAAQEADPTTLFKFLPEAMRKGTPQYAAQDVFGYAFLSDVFLADYKEGNDAWQGFLRPYRDEKEAKVHFDEYIAGVKLDGAEVKPLQAEGADEMVVCSNESIGMIDVVFRKGNTLAGANGATGVKPAEAFARAMAKTLPSKVPFIESGK